MSLKFGVLRLVPVNNSRYKVELKMTDDLKQCGYCQRKIDQPHNPDVVKCPHIDFDGRPGCDDCLQYIDGQPCCCGCSWGLNKKIDDESEWTTTVTYYGPPRPPRPPQPPQ